MTKVAFSNKAAARSSAENVISLMAGTPFSDQRQISLKSSFRSPFCKVSGKAVNDVDLSGRLM